MQIFLPENFKYFFILVILAGIFFGLVALGALRGKRGAQSDLVLQQTMAVETGLNFFYSDNTRFPTADEFARPEIMLNYLSRMPEATDLNSSECEQTLQYNRPQINSFELAFCLTKAVGEYKVGWNKVGKNF